MALPSEQGSEEAFYGVDNVVDNLLDGIAQSLKEAAAFFLGFVFFRLLGFFLYRFLCLEFHGLGFAVCHFHIGSFSGQRIAFRQDALGCRLDIGRREGMGLTCRAVGRQGCGSQFASRSVDQTNVGDGISGGHLRNLRGFF